MEVEPSTWYSSRVTLPSPDPAHGRLTSQPCPCSNHHSTWAQICFKLLLSAEQGKSHYLKLSWPRFLMHISLGNLRSPARQCEWKFRQASGKQAWASGILYRLYKTLSSSGECQKFFVSQPAYTYQTSNIRCTLVSNKLVDHSDVVGAYYNFKYLRKKSHGRRMDNRYGQFIVLSS